LAVVPLAFVPERLIVGRAREGSGGPRIGVARVLVAGAVLSGALWWFVPSPAFASAAALLTVAVLVGAELEVDVRGPVPPLVVVVVLAAPIVVPGAGAYAVAPLAALLTTGAAWSLSGQPRVTRRVVAAVVVVMGASLLVVGVAALLRASLGVPLAVAVAVTAVPASALLIGDRRRVRLIAFGWSAPVVAVALAVACVWRIVGPGGGALFALWLTGLALMAVSYGAPPWRGRLTARRTRRAPPTVHRSGLVVAALGVALLAAAAVGATTRDARAVAAWLAVALVASLATVDLVGIRQWRLAPRARAGAGAVAAAAACVGSGAGAALAVGHRWWAGPLCCAAAALVAAGWRPARCADSVDADVDAGRRS
jgi:hypothetical protein